MKHSAALPIVLICLGSVWFLKSTTLLPNTATLLALLLALAGIVLMVVDGFNKSTLLTSPMLWYGAAAVYLYDAIGLQLGHVLSLGMVLLGVLMLLVRSDKIPERSKRRRSHPNDNR
ncbi:MAG TPA: hypothetical protein VJ642_07485 [Chromobacteriaceae bacterium]|nr:hypothetical protein [Chromobacteriaceae bacterium]